MWLQGTSRCSENPLQRVKRQKGRHQASVWVASGCAGLLLLSVEGGSYVNLGSIRKSQ